ncbi:helix-turn-helix domain-containing protein [Arthrobacter agilis]|uniref:helix-turn-helix domain-containing protein n=1 Tax=Arthrobacter agilis TaxID=37921 RepID=UPI00278ADC12|nr:helix-turn-helix transcriptional regulator [Arthrobacter agilis]MDQ0735302.1 transcriptional regulator with XRE-family HTH domain [Arthrobacter agilis]
MALGKNMEPSDLTKRVAAVIRAQMAYKDISQAELVRATGLSQPTVSRLLKGERAMDLEQMNLICSALRISVAGVLEQAEEHLRNQGATVTQLRPTVSDDVSSLVERSAARNGKGNKQEHGESST